MERGGLVAGAFRVVVADQVADDLAIEIAALEPIGAELVLAGSPDEDSLVAAVPDADAILVTYAKVSARVIEAAPRCRIVARYGIGYDNVDVTAASRAGMFVTNVPDYCLDEVADHTLALLLGVARGVVAASARVRDGHWDGGTGDIHRLRGRRLALIGVGGIGRRVALRARACGLDVVSYDPYLADWNVADVERAATLDEAVAEADFVSLHMPLSEATHHIVNAELIASMRRAPVLINTARGPLVDHDALAAALASGAISGAALDVTEPEPLPRDHPLRRDPRAVITAHMAFYSVEAGEELRRRAAEEVGRVLRGIAPEHAINREAIDAARA
jgi:D-3-phosphoglycerate dehydrogenase